MPKILGVDIESANAETENNRILELGMVLWDWERQVPLAVEGYLIQPYNDVVIEPGAYEKHGISDGECCRFGVPWNVAADRFRSLQELSEWNAAHNGNSFDGPVLDGFLEAFGLPKSQDRWIDTLQDIPYPDGVHSRRLDYLAADHGFLNPFRHRAVFDVMTMFAVMGNYSLDQILEFRASPMLRVIAHVSFAQKDKAKEQRFIWDGNAKQWYKDMRALTLEREKHKYEFKFTTEEIQNGR